MLLFSVITLIKDKIIKERIKRSCPVFAQDCFTSFRNNDKGRGFTLIELLVVVLIISILAAIALPQYQRAVGKSRASEALMVMRSIVDAQEAYFLATGGYTNNFENLVISVPQERIYATASSEIKNKYYTYLCFNKRSCKAFAPNSIMPSLEFHMTCKDANAVGFSDTNKGKRWCMTTTENLKTHSICKSLGGIFDRISGDNTFYRLN